MELISIKVKCMTNEDKLERNLDCNCPTKITIEDFDKFVEKQKEYKVPLCNWCKKCEIVRDCGPNYICLECEIRERKSGRPLVFTSPVKDAYFVVQ